MTQTTNKLSQKRCLPCEGKEKPLEKEAILDYLNDTPEWSVSDDNTCLVRTFDMKNFVAAILDKTPLIAPAREGIHSVELANAMLYSSLIGKTVELPLNGRAYERKLKAMIKKGIEQVEALDAKFFGGVEQKKSAVDFLDSTIREFDEKPGARKCYIADDSRLIYVLQGVNNSTLHRIIGDENYRIYNKVTNSIISNLPTVKMRNPYPPEWKDN